MVQNNLKKLDISKCLSKKKGFSLLLSKKLINNLIDLLVLNIKNGDLIIKNIGTFKLIKKKKRIGRNPKTKEIFTISERQSIKFTPSLILKKNLNKNG